GPGEGPTENWELESGSKIHPDPGLGAQAGVVCGVVLGAEVDSEARQHLDSKRPKWSIIGVTPKEAKAESGHVPQTNADAALVFTLRFGLLWNDAGSSALRLRHLEGVGVGFCACLFVKNLFLFFFSRIRLNLFYA
ncbi:unnamed protein product, partial [Ixodes pacificus]